MGSDRHRCRLYHGSLYDDAGGGVPPQCNKPDPLNKPRDLFVKDPDRYTPQYDGYCAMGVSNGEAAHKDTVDPEAWAIVDGKLYFTHNKYWLQVWLEQPSNTSSVPTPTGRLSPIGRSQSSSGRLRCFPADNERRATRRRVLGRRRRAGRPRRGWKSHRQGRSPGADRTSRQER